VGNVRREHLDGDLALKHQILGQKHHGHSPAPQQPNDFVSAGQGAYQPLPQLISRVCRTGVAELAGGSTAMGAEAAIHRKGRVTPGALVHRVHPGTTGAIRFISLPVPEVVASF
jgi:hypothetical protein